MQNECNPRYQLRNKVKMHSKNLVRVFMCPWVFSIYFYTHISNQKMLQTLNVQYFSIIILICNCQLVKTKE